VPVAVVDELKVVEVYIAGGKAPSVALTELYLLPERLEAGPAVEDAGHLVGH